MIHSYVRRTRGVDAVLAWMKKSLELDVRNPPPQHRLSTKLTSVGTNATLVEANVPTGSTMGPQNEYGCLIDHSTTECGLCCKDEPSVVGRLYIQRGKQLNAIG